MNNNHYIKQRQRAQARKLEIIEMLGGKCSICGYDKNIAALEFHHLDPTQKEMKLDARRLANTSSEKIMNELNKCILVCANCHRELHNPEQDKEVVYDLKKTSINKSILAPPRKMAICPQCGKEYPYAKGKIFCSKECRMKSKGYPSKEEVELKYKELKSQDKVAEYFGLTRKIIKGILKQD